MKQRDEELEDDIAAEAVAIIDRYATLKTIIEKRKPDTQTIMRGVFKAANIIIREIDRARNPRAESKH